MKYLSIDIETTGLRYSDPADMDNILSMGLVADDLENPLPVADLPMAHILVDVTQEVIQGSIYAFAMHAMLMQQIITLKKSHLPNSLSYDPSKQIFFALREDVAHIIAGFVDHHGLRQDNRSAINVAGKNVISFDIPFLNNACWLDKKVRVRRRALDPSMAFARPEDKCLPDLSECKRRAGFADIEVAHTALEDAIDVVRLVRHAFNIEEV